MLRKSVDFQWFGKYGVKDIGFLISVDLSSVDSRGSPGLFGLQPQCRRTPSVFLLFQYPRVVDHGYGCTDREPDTTFGLGVRGDVTLGNFESGPFCLTPTSVSVPPSPSQLRGHPLHKNGGEDRSVPYREQRGGCRIHPH